MGLINDLRIQESFRGYIRDLNFQNPIAVTLTLKKAVPFREEKSHGYVRITPDRASQNLRHFLNSVNSQCLGKKASRFGHRIPVVSVLEGTKAKRLHYHLMMDWPKDDTAKDISKTISANWQKTLWGYNQIDVQTNADEGWINYITKVRDKEDYSSSIDWENISRSD